MLEEGGGREGKVKEGDVSEVKTIRTHVTNWYSLQFAV